jgi:hypothetical protein
VPGCAVAPLDRRARPVLGNHVYRGQSRPVAAVGRSTATDAGRCQQVSQSMPAPSLSIEGTMNVFTRTIRC